MDCSMSIVQGASKAGNGRNVPLTMLPDRLEASRMSWVRNTHMQIHAHTRKHASMQSKTRGSSSQRLKTEVMCNPVRTGW